MRRESVNRFRCRQGRKISVLIIMSVFLFILTGCSVLSMPSIEELAKKQEIQNSREKQTTDQKTAEAPAQLTEYVSVTITNVNPDSSTGTVSITMPDLKAIYLANQEAFLADPDASFMRDMIKKNLDEFTVSKSFEAELYKDGAQWKLASTDEIAALAAQILDEYLSAVLVDVDLGDITVDVNVEELLK